MEDGRFILCGNCVKAKKYRILVNIKIKFNEYFIKCHIPFVDNYIHIMLLYTFTAPYKCQLAEHSGILDK